MAIESGARQVQRAFRFGRILVCLLCLAVPGFAQQLGHYLQGFAGLGSGSTLPPGVYVAYLPYTNMYESIRGPQGQTLQLGDFNSTAHNIVATYMTKKKVFGAEYGIMVDAPFANARLTGERLDFEESFGGYSDTFVMPLVLGWKSPKVDTIVTYGFVAPTGSFDPTSPTNAGLGFWTNLFQIGSSFGIDKARTWNGTFMTTWEFHTKKKDIDMTVGPGVTLEYAFGYRFHKGMANVGVSGHLYQKLSHDSGSAVNPLVYGLTDRVLGLGPEFQYIVPKWKMAFLARYQPQFQARNRLQGNVLVFGVTYMHMSH